MQLANQRREGHVDDRDVEVDHERCQQQRDENQGTASHGSCDLHEASWPSNLWTTVVESVASRNWRFRTLPDGGCVTQLTCATIGGDAEPRLRRPELLDRASARGCRRA